METQFELLRLGFREFSKTRGVKRFFESKHRLEQSEFEAKVPKFTADLGLDPDDIDGLKQAKKRELKGKWGGQKRKLYLEEYVEDDLNKSELLLLVALFEGYLNDVYETLLRAEPRRAFAKSQKEVALAKIFTDNADTWKTSIFFRKTVEEELGRFEHMSFEERMIFFMKAYGLKTERTEIENANELINRRHSISHRWTDREEVKHVSPQDLKDARRVFCSIPQRLVLQASEQYPKHFTHY